MMNDAKCTVSRIFKAFYIKKRRYSNALYHSIILQLPRFYLQSKQIMVGIVTEIIYN